MPRLNGRRGMEGDSGKRKVRMKKLVNDQDTTTTRATDLSRYVIAYLSNEKKEHCQKRERKGRNWSRRHGVCTYGKE